MTVSVVIPYAGDDPHRQASLAWILDRYRATFPDWQVVTGTADPDRWCKAEAVADALARADGDILVIADADCWADKTGQVVRGVTAGAAWAMPHYRVHRLTEAATGRVLAGEIPLEHADTYRRHDGTLAGGIVVLPRALYETVPLDRRFVGWGGEDSAWGYALSTLAGPPQRLRGVCWHLWHEPAWKTPGLHGMSGSRESEALRKRYEAAIRKPAQMRALIEEAGWQQGTRPSSASGPSASTSTATPSKANPTS